MCKCVVCTSTPTTVVFVGFVSDPFCIHLFIILGPILFGHFPQSGVSSRALAGITLDEEGMPSM